MPPETDRSRCALCGGPNGCAMARRAAGEESDRPCWCVSREFPLALLERATALDGRERCVCAACLGRDPGPQRSRGDVS